MEFLLELLFDIIVEGSIALGSEKKVPMPIRIIAFLVVGTIFFGMGAVLIYTGYDAYTVGAIPGAIFAVAIGGFMIIGGIFIAYKMFKKKREQDNET